MLSGMQQPIEGTQLINTDGRSTSPCGTNVMSVNLGELQVDHKFMILDTLSTPVILGCDFLTKHSVRNKSQKLVSCFLDNQTFCRFLIAVPLKMCSKFGNQNGLWSAKC